MNRTEPDLYDLQFKKIEKDRTADRSGLVKTDLNYLGLNYYPV